jgi:LPS export ABC transporter protein LptC
VVILWIFQEELIFSFKNKSNQRIEFITDLDKEDSYFEKIEGFVINEYSSEEKILYTIDAGEYYSYKESPIKLVTVEVKTYNENQEEGAILLSNEAQILETSEIIFKGNVDIETLSGVFHELQSESFVYNSDEGQISSNKKVLYQGANAKINSEGMLMSIDNDELLLKGAVIINQDPDILIESSNLFINNSKGAKLYKSEEKTIYVSPENKITAESGVEIDMVKNLTKLVGKVEIIENSGTKIFSSDLIVENDGDMEIYKTDKPSEYISKQSNIKANNMYYDVLSKKIDLTGKVLGVYE